MLDTHTSKTVLVHAGELQRFVLRIKCANLQQRINGLLELSLIHI